MCMSRCGQRIALKSRKYEVLQPGVLLRRTLLLLRWPGFGCMSPWLWRPAAHRCRKHLSRTCSCCPSVGAKLSDSGPVQSGARALCGARALGLQAVRRLAPSAERYCRKWKCRQEVSLEGFNPKNPGLMMVIIRPWGRKTGGSPIGVPWPNIRHLQASLFSCWHETTKNSNSRATSKVILGKSTSISSEPENREAWVSFTTRYCN
jgi:hypothetical protein